MIGGVRGRQLVDRRRLGFVGQEEAVWNRATPGGWDERGLCAYCRDAFHHIDLITLSLIDDPFDGAEPMILVGGEFVHTDCAEQAARAITPSPYAFPHASEETRSRLRTRLRSGDAVLT
jgi:hypothetical protein